MIPLIIRDRDEYRTWYLDEDFICTLTDGSVLAINKGYRFNGHSTKPFHWIFAQYDVDIVAAMIHDYLLDTSPWHRYNRAFIDSQYKHFMDVYSYGFRRHIMPVAVFLWGYMTNTIWGDYRGEPKPNTVISVVVSHDDVV